MAAKIDNQFDSEDTSNLSVREMARNEVDFTIELAAREGWNPGLQRCRFFLSHGPAWILHRPVKRPTDRLLR
jgi:hypothetical protein